MKLTPNDFKNIFGPLTPFVTEKIESYQFQHETLHNHDLEEALVEIIKDTYTDLPRSGPARHPIWEKGWGENLADFDPSQAGPALAKPRYFNKHPLVRWNKQLHRAVSTDYEYNMLATIQHWLFDKWFRDCPAVHEFGCGTGHNLFRVREVNKNAHLVGLDWAESAVRFINLQAKHGADNNMEARRFDFFHPHRYTLPHLGPEDGVYTVAALEQVGDKFGPFLEYLIEQRPAWVAHVEPFEEFLNPTCLLDHLSLEYFKRRNYLSGYLAELRRLEADKRIYIHEQLRTRVGSKFIEGYNVVVWTPRRGIFR